MAGLRLTHPTLRGVTLTIEVESRPYTQPLACGTCGSFHENKTYHLDLDGEGAVIVSQQVWDQLQRCETNPLRFANEVSTPPSRTLALGTKGGFVLRHPTLRDTMFVVEDPSKPYRATYSCGLCKREHRFKAYHLNLTDNGTARVSKETFQAIESLGFAGLEVVQSEDITLDLGGSSGSYRVVAHQP